MIKLLIFMNLLFLFTFNYNLDKWNNSGILEREFKYFNKLHENNIEITLVTYGDEKDKVFNENKNITIFPIFEHVKKPNNKVWGIIKSIYYPIIIFKNCKFDIIKQNQLQGSWVALLLKLISRKPLIIRTGYDVVLFSIKNKASKIKTFFYYLLTQCCLIFSDLYTVSSNDDFQFLNKYYLTSKNKIIVRRNWIDTIKNTKPFEKKIDDTVISVGRLEIQKNYFKLIDFLSASNLKLIIYGSGSQKNSLLRYANKKNVEINIFKPIKNYELLKTLSNFKYFVSTSLFEGNPKAILEAMGVGCIVAAPNNSNNSEIIINGKNGYLYNINSDNPINLIKNSKNLVSISNESIQFINENYSLNNFINLEIEELTNVKK